MSEAGSKVMTGVALAVDFRAIYREVLTENVSDLDLATILLDSSFFAIRNADDQELFFATSNYLDAFLAAAVPRTVDFNEDRLKIWAKEALEFARQNVRHESFSDIFSTRLQYESVLQGLLIFERSGDFLLEYFEQLRIDSGYVSDSLPAPFLAAVQTSAREAIRPALVGLSHHLLRHKNIGKPRGGAKVSGVLAVRRSPSFLNEKGTIPFSESAGRFSLNPATETDQLAQYQPVVDRAIKKLGEARVIQRIGNKDRLLAALLSEYKDEVARTPKRVRVPVLWSIGIEIEGRIRAQEDVKDRDERLDDGDMFDLRRLMVSHNLYLNCFKQAASLLKDIEASAAIYQRIGAAGRHLPGLLLRRALQEESLLETETAATIGRSISSEASDAIESKGVVALRLGLLRGLLHAVGGHLLNGIEKVIGEATVDVSSKLLLEVLRGDANFVALLTFLDHQAFALVQLSDQAPIYFGYVRGILGLLGIRV